MKTFALCVLMATCALLPQQVSAQLKDKMFHSVGYTAFADVYKTPPKTIRYIDEYTGDTTNFHDYLIGVSYATFIYTLRFNVYEPSDEMALGLTLTPSLGVLSFGTFGYSSSVGYLSLSIPLYLTAEFGAGSTYSSTANVGGVVGIGGEYMKAPLFVGNNDISYFYGTALEDEKTIKSSWFQPSFYTGIRYWSRKNRMREITVKGGFTGKKDVSDSGDTGRGFAVRLGFMYILNY